MGLQNVDMNNVQDVWGWYGISPFHYIFINYKNVLCWSDKRSSLKTFALKLLNQYFTLTMDDMTMNNAKGVVSRGEGTENYHLQTLRYPFSSHRARYIPQDVSNKCLFVTDENNP